MHSEDGETVVHGPTITITSVDNCFPSTLFQINLWTAQSLSTHMAMPIPPPMQRDATPFRPPVLCSACNKVTSTLQPDMPIGWPREMAPPLTFTWRRKACFDARRFYCSFSQCVRLLLCLRSDRALSPRREIEQQTPHWSQINPLAPAASLLFPPVKHSYNTKDFFF